MTNSDIPRERPLSPHLQVYSPMLTMMMSIVHRITGAALYFGTVLIIWWLIAAASGPSHFELANAVLSSWIGLLVLLGYTWAAIHHMLGGIKHLFWDMGRGFELNTVELNARLTLAGSVVLTILVWVIAYGVS
ncbi:MAG: succinate dehydrogenase, cytochrome b556 subunit [Pseudomonadota bacterium]